MSPEDLFRENLPLIERVIAGICRRSGLRDADAEDFASIVKLALIENDYAILRGYEGRAPLGAFLAVVVQRLLSREWVRLRGRWRPSAEAERNGDAAVLIEKLTVRDGRSVDEAIEIACNVDPSLDRARGRELAARLPARAPRPRLVPMPEDEVRFVAPETADARANEAEARRLSERAAQAVRETVAALPLEDRMLIRFHFGAQMSIADASRMLGVPQRPLYRRIEALLRQLRGALERAGIGQAAIEEMISAGASESLDFGLGDGKSGPARHTSAVEDDIGLPD
ncbi:MAG TPA: sigma-70 family RNA polymerase sigma factor [Vicinamibacterales bacterium]